MSPESPEYVLAGGDPGTWVVLGVFVAWIIGTFIAGKPKDGDDQ